MRPHLPFAALVLLSAAMQTVIFPVAGPLPFLRAQIAWVAYVPWLLLLFTVEAQGRRPIARAALWSYLCGALWYLGHCYWIFQTMHEYGNLSVLMAAVVLVLFCLYLGLYHALYGALASLLLRRFRVSLHPVLLSVLLACTWVTVELARGRITSFPWDLLGYSQIDNSALTAMAPITGVYGIGFVVFFVNAALALVLHTDSLPQTRESKRASSALRKSGRGLVLLSAVTVAVLCVTASILYAPPLPASTQQATAVQPNLNFSSQPVPSATPLEHQLASLTVQAVQSAPPPRPGLVLWPEAPTPWEIHEPLLQSTLAGLAQKTDTVVLADSNALELDGARARHTRIYNSAGLFTSQGLQARYDKIHLVPFGEFVPYADLFQFAGGLTEQVGTFNRGTRRIPLSAAGHSYGVFICYESIFPEEVRQLVQRGAQVLVNLSDDGWYGDTSAPFQHSNMARMRAIENRRWLLRDTNTGITEAIDPYGNVRAAAPRHQRLAVTLPYSYDDGQTFYTRHGDLCAWFCASVAAVALLLSIAGLTSRAG